MDQERLEAAIAEWLRRLNLTHWTVRIAESEPDDSDAIMSIVPIEGRFVADLHIGKGFYESSPQEQSNSIAHELIHMPEDKIRDVVRYMTKNMGTDIKEAIYDMVTMEVEFLTDWMATVLSEQLPIPESLLEDEDNNPGLTD